jgi:hypothetical protein
MYLFIIEIYIYILMYVEFSILNINISSYLIKIDKINKIKSGRRCYELTILNKTIKNNLILEIFKCIIYFYFTLRFM